MDRKNYDRTTIGVFDTIGSFFIDVFYNNHYLFARDLVKSGRAKSITDSYRSTIMNYMSGITTRRDLYMTVAKTLHEYYQKSSGFGSIVFSEFEDKVLAQFIPREYYRDFTEKHKDNTLHEIIVKTVNELGEVVLQRDTLHKIIDDHRNPANVSYLQDRIVDIFIFQREDYYARFAEEISKKNTGDKISKKVVDKLKAAFVEEKKGRCEAEADRDRAVGMISQLVKKISRLEAEVESLKQQCQQQSGAELSIVQNMAKRNHEQPKTIQSARVTLLDESTQSSIDDSSEGDEEIYKKQREMIAQRRLRGLERNIPQPPEQTETQESNTGVFSLLDDDPGFGGN